MDLVEQYLMNEKPFLIPFDPSSNNTAVIVEPRPLPILPYIIWNVMRNLGKGWNLVVFGSSQNAEFLRKILKGDFLFLNPEIDNFNHKSYSLLLESLTFWERIPGENILIFQWDSFMLKPFDESIYQMFEKYAFIGAFYHFMHPIKKIDFSCPVGYNYNINGGFSFRKKSAMMHCIRNVSNFDIIEFRKKNNMENEYFIHNIIMNEDVFFVNALVLLGFPLPSVQECSQFCNQVNNRIETTCAIHNYQYPYVPREFLEKMLKTHPNTI